MATILEVKPVAPVLTAEERAARGIVNKEDVKHAINLAAQRAADGERSMIDFAKTCFLAVRCKELSFEDRKEIYKQYATRKNELSQYSEIKVDDASSVSQLGRYFKLASRKGKADVVWSIVTDTLKFIAAEKVKGSNYSLVGKVLAVVIAKKLNKVTDAQIAAVLKPAKAVSDDLVRDELLKLQAKAVALSKSETFLTHSARFAAIAASVTEQLDAYKVWAKAQAEATPEPVETDEEIEEGEDEEVEGAIVNGVNEHGDNVAELLAQLSSKGGVVDAAALEAAMH